MRITVLVPRYWWNIERSYITDKKTLFLIVCLLIELREKSDAATMHHVAAEALTNHFQIWFLSHF